MTSASRLRILLSLILLTFIPAASHGQLISDYFVRTSTPELLYADAAGPGATTSREYTGLIEVRVSGLWTNNPTQSYDGCFQVTPVLGPHRYSLTLGFSGCSWILECGGEHFCLWVTFLEGVGFVQPCLQIPEGSHVPKFNPEHEYGLVLDLGSSPVRPTFGTGDGGTFDNSGGFDIEIYQLEFGPTSTQPATWSQVKRTRSFE